MATTAHHLPNNLAFSMTLKKAFRSWSEKVEYLVTSIFSFSNNIFKPSRDKHISLSKTKFVVCERNQFGQLQTFLVWYTVNRFNPDQAIPKEEIIVEKEENGVNQHFLLFPLCFLLF